MRPLFLASLLFILLSLFLRAQQRQATAGDLFQFYEKHIAAGNDELAISCLEKSNDLSRCSPLSSTALGVMYLIGRGVEMDSTEVILSFSASVNFDYINSDEYLKKHELSMRRMGTNEKNIKDEVSYLRQVRDQGMEQYQLYMRLDETKTRMLQAFCSRWLACNDMVSIDEAIADGDIEAKLEAAAEGLENALMADSLAGDAFAEYLLGRLYYEGCLGMRDKQLGIHYFEQAASKGCISALTYLGEIKAKSDDTATARQLWLQATREKIYPIEPITRANIDYIASPNLDLYDTRAMQLKAIQHLK